MKAGDLVAYHHKGGTLAARVEEVQPDGVVRIRVKSTQRVLLVSAKGLEAVTAGLWSSMR